MQVRHGLGPVDPGHGRCDLPHVQIRGNPLHKACSQAKRRISRSVCQLADDGMRVSPMRFTPVSSDWCRTKSSDTRVVDVMEGNLEPRRDEDRSTQQGETIKRIERSEGFCGECHNETHRFACHPRGSVKLAAGPLAWIKCRLVSSKVQRRSHDQEQDDKRPDSAPHRPCPFRGTMMSPRRSAGFQLYSIPRSWVKHFVGSTAGQTTRTQG